MASLSPLRVQKSPTAFAAWSGRAADSADEGALKRRAINPSLLERCKCGGMMRNARAR
jgi:hypothetical protein